jgi:hypothetical protein
MIGGLCQFSINFQPLMGQLEIGCPAGLLKGFHLALEDMVALIVIRHGYQTSQR